MKLEKYLQEDYSSFRFTKSSKLSVEGISISLSQLKSLKKFLYNNDPHSAIERDIFSFLQDVLKHFEPAYKSISILSDEDKI